MQTVNLFNLRKTDDYSFLYDMLDGIEGFESFPSQDECYYVSADESYYNGSYRIIWNKNGVWYEAEDSHCSCRRWESFDPDEVSEEYVIVTLQRLLGVDKS